MESLPEQFSAQTWTLMSLFFLIKMSRCAADTIPANTLGELASELAQPPIHTHLDPVVQTNDTVPTTTIESVQNLR